MKATLRDFTKPLYSKPYVNLKTVEERVLNLTAADTLEEMRSDLVAADALAKILRRAAGNLKTEEIEQVVGTIEGYISSVLSWALWTVDAQAAPQRSKTNGNPAAC